MTKAPKILILQGPLSTFYSDIATALKDRNVEVFKVHICGNDRMDWKHAGALNYPGKLEGFAEFLEKNFGDRGITHVLMHGDRRPYHLQGAFFARKAGAEVFVTELGYLRPDWMTCEKNGVSTLSHFPTDPDQIKKIAEDCQRLDRTVLYPDDPLKRVVHELRFNFFNWLFRSRYPHYQSHRIDSVFDVYSGFIARKLTQRSALKRGRLAFEDLQKTSRPHFVFALQLAGDFQLRDHSPFQSLREAIDYVMSSFAKNAPQDALLVVKPHPLDFTLKKTLKALDEGAERYNLEDRWRLVEGLPIRTIAEGAAGFVTINSSAGMEALESGSPVMCVMPTIYDVAGLTYQGNLDQFWSDTSSPNQQFYEVFCRALAGTIQFRGTIYNDSGRLNAAEEIAHWLINGTNDQASVFTDFPERIEKANMMGVDYSEL